MEIEAAAEIERLWNLKSSGAITDEEFQTMKQNLLRAEASGEKAQTPFSGPEPTSTAASALADPLSRSPENKSAEPQPLPAGRKVPVMLFVGIALLPIIFVWFLLRSGHTAQSRILGFGWLAFLTVLILNTDTTPSTKTPNEIGKTDGNSAGSQSSAYSSSGEPLANPSLWSYSDSADSMRGTVGHIATVTADTKLDFEFPYNKGTTVDLNLRKKAGSTDVYLLASSGQFMCNSFSETHVSVKFDDGPVQNYSCTDSASNKTGLIFILNERKFVANLKKAKKVVIEAEFFQSGRHQIAFDVHGLVWK